MIDYFGDEKHKETTDWLLSKGFIRDEGRLGKCWSTRIGIDSTSLLFWPHDLGWEAIIGHHASGTNPELGIGTCETLEDIQMVYNTIRLINGYKKPDEE